jgi:hypothetical protein
MTGGPVAWRPPRARPDGNRARAVLVGWAALWMLVTSPAGSQTVKPSPPPPTNEPAPAAHYEVTVPGHDWIVSWSAPEAERTYPLLVASGAQPVRRLRIGQTSLKNPDSGQTVEFSRFALADASAPAGSIELNANETRTVLVRLDPGRSAGPFGTFAGQIQLVSDGTRPKPVALTLRVTSGPVKILGSFLVLAGLLTSLLLTNYLQPRLVWLQALRPVALLRQLVNGFIEQTSTAAGEDADGIVSEARRQSDRLDPALLAAAGLLPFRLRTADAAPSSTSQLQALLQEVSGRLAGLVVLRDEVMRLRRHHPPGSRPKEVSSAIAQLNAFAPRAVSAELALVEVERTQSLAVAEGAGTGRPTALTPERVEFMLQQTANLGALIWAAVSLAIGIAYVYSDVDFGTPIDLLGMFLWGFGLTTLGAGIQQLTPKSVSAQIGFGVPKTGAGN